MIKKWIRKIAVLLLNVFYHDADIKLSMILQILRHRYIPLTISDYGVGSEFFDVREKDVLDVFQKLDSESQKTALRFLTASQLTRYVKPPKDAAGLPVIFIDSDRWKYFDEMFAKFTLEEGTKLRQARKKYCIAGNAESLVHHHGLARLSADARRYIKDGYFLDIGAFNGDSAVILAEYGPKKIYAFEPSAENGRQLRENMKKAGIPESQYELIPFVVGEKEGKVSFSEDHNDLSSSRIDASNEENDKTFYDMTTVDSFCLPKNSRISIIKADIEGAGLLMLKGAVETIKRDRPVLSLAIYHNPEEFFEQYKLLESLGLNYQYRIEALACGVKELTLTAYPGELE